MDENEKTQITSRFIADQAIKRNKLNVSAEGQAVIAKIVEEEGTGIKIKSSSGADKGTGDVVLEFDQELLDSRYSGKPVDCQLIGNVDGSNKIFSTPEPYESGTITVFRNGLKYRDFIEVPDSDTQIELFEAPLNTGFSDLIEAIYIKKPI